MGPSARKGKKVNTTTISIVATRTIEKVTLSVFNPISAVLFL
jgi:hypothetical protein